MAPEGSRREGRRHKDSQVIKRLHQILRPDLEKTTVKNIRSSSRPT